MITRSYTFVGESAGDRAGFSTEFGQDYDGDGFADIFIGAQAFDDGATGDTGALYLIGSAQLAAADGDGDGVIDLGDVAALSDSYRFVGEGAGDLAGGQIDASADLTGDGVRDIVILAQNDSLYVLSGAQLAAADGNNDGTINLSDVAALSDSYQFIPTGTFDLAPSFIIPAPDSLSTGDVDGDGRMDLLIGAPLGGGGGRGVSYLLSGTEFDAADGNNDGIISLGDIAAQTNSFEILGSTGSDALGSSVSISGDVDNDGRSEILVSQPREAHTTTIDDGAAYLLNATQLAAADGNNDGIINVDDITTSTLSYEFLDTSPTERDLLGARVSLAGDFDNDGDEDIVIAASGSDVSMGNAGVIYVLNADELANADLNADGTIEVDDIAALSGSYQINGVLFGTGDSIEAFGDVTGDGIDDLLVGSALGSSFYVISGTQFATIDGLDGATDGIINASNISQASDSYQFVTGPGFTGSRLGQFLSSAGDVDGDTVNDIIVGAPFGSLGGASSGQGVILRAADLEAADNSNGTTDGIISTLNLVYDNTVVGTGGADTIDANFLGDFGLDRVDNFDSTGDDNNDIIDAGDGGDTIVGSLGDDTVDGNTGTDTYQAGVVGFQTTTVSVDNTGSGTAIKVGEGTDTLSRIENFTALEAALENDEITLTTTVTDRTTIQNIDTTNATGLFTAGVGSGQATTVFGPGGGIPTLQDILDRDGAIGTISIMGGDEAGTIGNIGFSNFETINFSVVCFAAGTRIETKHGPVAVEYLAPGDLVKTMDHGPQPIRWIGSSCHAAVGKSAPVLFHAGAIGNDCDLKVSPQHRMLVAGWQAEVMFGEPEVLVPAKAMINGDTIVSQPGGTVEYYHILMDCHEILFAEGAPAESFFPYKQAWEALNTVQRSEILALHPEFLSAGFEAYGPLARPTLTYKEARGLRNSLFSTNILTGTPGAI